MGILPALVPPHMKFFCCFHTRVFNFLACCSPLSTMQLQLHCSHILRISSSGKLWWQNTRNSNSVLQVNTSCVLCVSPFVFYWFFFQGIKTFPSCKIGKINNVYASCIWPMISSDCYVFRAKISGFWSNLITLWFGMTPCHLLEFPNPYCWPIFVFSCQVCERVYVMFLLLKTFFIKVTSSGQWQSR